MKLIFALGNPGTQYMHTRHNAGWLLVDTLVASQNLGTFQTKTKFSAQIIETIVDGNQVIIAKPTTFYNHVGQSAHQIINFYRISSPDILVIHDELSLEFGTLRMREKGRSAGNNGIQSLNAHIGEQYWRLRIGTNNELASRIDNADFVLSRFSADEQATLNTTIFPAALNMVDDFTLGTQQATSYSAE